MKELEVVAQMIEMQKKKLLATALRLVPNLTMDDLLQPNDFPILETHSEFRYEEGILAGLLSVQSALQALYLSS
jgi:hypothetical protein